MISILSKAATWSPEQPFGEAFSRVFSSRLCPAQLIWTAVIEYLARQETHYIVAVAGLPERMAGFVQRNPDALKENTMLKRKKKEPINPDDVQTQERTANFYFMFPKTDAITVDDKEVEFIMKTQRFEVKRKFKLKNMVFNGELSL